MYLLDTSAWIEILIGTEKGKKAKEITKKSQIFTAGISIAETSKWCQKEGANTKEKIEQIEKVSLQILHSTRLSEQRAGQLCFELNKKMTGKQIGLIDCLIAAIAEENDLIVLTKDRHFLLFKTIQKEII